MKYCRFLIFIFLSFLIITPAYSKSQKKSKDSLDYVEEDASLREIRKLIRETNYDEAFKLLTVYIKHNPDNFDNAQRLIAVIMEAKKKYAETLDKLIVLISTEPDNDEAIYNVIRELKKIERHPSDASLTYIDNIDRVVTFSHNQKESKRILTASADFSTADNYQDSLNVVKEGFSLYREQYEDRWGMESDILKETDLLVGELNTNLDFYFLEDFNERLNSALENFKINVEEENYYEAVNSYNVLTEVLKEFCDYRKNLYANGNKIRELNTRLQEIPEETTEEENSNAFFDTTDASYLPFLAHFIFGEETLPGSGIIPTLDLKYANIIKSLNTLVYNCVFNNYSKYTVFFKDNISSVEEFAMEGNPNKNINDFVSLENKIIALETGIYTESELEQSALGNSLENYVVLGDYVINLVNESERIYKVNSEINKIARKQENLFDAIGSEQSSAKQASLVSDLLNSIAEIGNLVGIKTEQELQSFDWAQNYNQNEYTEWNELSQLYTEYLDKVFLDSSSILNTGWQKIADYYVNSSDALVAGVVGYNSKVVQFSEGFGQKIGETVHSNILNDVKIGFTYTQTVTEEVDDDIKYKYPDISKLMAVYSRQALEKVIVQLDDYEKIIIDNYESHEQWKTDSGITTLVTDTKNHFEIQKASLKAFQAEADNLRDLSQKQIAAAEILKADAEYDFEDAENQLTRERFENARNKLKTCSEKYVRAFDIQSDEAFSKKCDEKIQELGMKITRMENEKVVRDVRELKTLAKAAYIDGRFDEAERYLSQAASRWAVTNSEEDEEIVNLQVFVNTAVSTKTGREILPSAPQYEEMTQLLTIAYQYYDQGVKDLNSGNNKESKENFDKAEASIKQLQLVYPLHQEAALLSLKINKLRDPVKFNETFAQKIENARMMCKSKDEGTKKEGYANLQDYYELDPNYKGLKNIIYQAEFDVGIRKNVDNSNIKKAKTAYDEANRLYKAGRLDAASRKISESLSLNPDDTAAQKLKDNITIAIGGTKIPLTTDAQKLYSKSYDCFVQNNMEMAEFYLNRLAQLDKRFMNDDDVQRLKAKIDALK